MQRAQVRVVLSDLIWNRAAVYARAVGKGRTGLISDALERWCTCSVTKEQVGQEEVRPSAAARTLLLPAQLARTVRSLAPRDPVVLGGIVEKAVAAYLKDLPTDVTAHATSTQAFDEQVSAVTDLFAVHRRKHWQNTGPRPELIMLTVTFNSRSSDSGDLHAGTAGKLLLHFDELYRHLCSGLIGNNWAAPRLRHLQPLTWAWIDTHGTRHAAPNYDRAWRGKWRPSYCAGNSTASRCGTIVEGPHIHAIMLVPPRLVRQFKDLTSVEGLNALMRKLPWARDLHVQFVRVGDLRKVISYCAKNLRVCRSVQHGDLYGVWPRAVSEASHKPVHKRGITKSGPRERADRMQPTKTSGDERIGADDHEPSTGQVMLVTARL